MEAEIRDDDVDAEISLARVLLTAGLPDRAAKLVKPWPQWVKGKDARRQSNIVNALIPVLIGLALDQDVQSAAGIVSTMADRSQCLSKAADEYFSIGRNDIASSVDIEARRLAVWSPTGDSKLQWDHDAALNNLALARAGHGDIQGALDVAAKPGDEGKLREVTYYVVRHAIDTGHGPVAGPAIEALEQHANANAGLLLQAAKGWYDIAEEEVARRSLAKATKLADEHRAPLTGDNLGLAAELTWRLDGTGKVESIIAIVDKLGVNDPDAIDYLVDIIKPISPGVAVRLASRQVEVERRIDELANIAIQIAGDAK